MSFCTWVWTFLVLTVIVSNVRCLSNKFNGNLDCGHLLQNQTTTYDHSGKDLKLLYEYKQFLCLIASRLKIGQDVALYKWQNHKAIFDPKREQSILASVVGKANSFGLDRVWSSHFFQDQMQANRKIQEYLFAQWKCNNVKFVAGPSIVDLYATIRPQLDVINRQLIQLAERTIIFRSSEWCLPLTDFHLASIDREYSFDVNEASIYHEYALRNACLL